MVKKINYYWKSTFYKVFSFTLTHAFHLFLSCKNAHHDFVKKVSENAQVQHTVFE